MKIYEIMPSLYQRGEFVKLPDRISNIKELGIDIVINLVNVHDLALRQHLFWYAHYPIGDGKSIDSQLLYELATYAAYYIQGGHKVLTHCHAGRNRSGFVNALIVMQLLDISGKKAMKVVRDARPNAIANPYFEYLLTNIKKIEDILCY